MKARLCVGITGHRQDDPLFTERREQIAAAVAHVFELIDRAVAQEAREPGIELAATRLHGLLADGTDQLAAQAALDRGWELIAPLPFGLTLAATIGAQPRDAAEARALLAGGQPQGPGIRAEACERAERLYQLAARARLFELADSDAKIAEMLLARLEDPDDPRKQAVLDAEVSLRAAMASRVVVEQSDFLVAVWDGVTRAAVGGTGHTIQAALEAGAAVVWIDASQPTRWRLLSGAEALADIGTRTAPAEDGERIARLGALVRLAVRPAAPRGHGVLRGRGSRQGAETLAGATSPVPGTAEAIARDSAAELLATARDLPGQDLRHVAAIETEVLQRFASADAASARVSDIYRSAMMANFLLAALAVAGGAACLLWAGTPAAWLSALFALAMLAGILGLTLISRRHRWYRRWREARRVAEYLRQAPVLLLLGVTRPAGRWPVGMHTSWPEWYARHVLREPGLPQLAITADYLRRALHELFRQHVASQLDYYRAKARRMATIGRNLDRLSIGLLSLALLAIAVCLLLDSDPWPAMGPLAAVFAFLGVALPAVAAALAGIRYFGDFERLAELSSVTAEKLQAIGRRAERLLTAQDGELDYGRVAHLAHALEEVVVSDIESWQPVFGGNDVTLPV